MSGFPAAAMSVGNQSRPEKIPFSTVPGLIWPGQRAIHGTRKPPSPTVPLVYLNGVIPPCENFRAVVCREYNDGVICFAHVVQVFQQRTNIVVHISHPGLFQTIVS